VVVDESMFEYAPGHTAKLKAEQLGEPIPVVYIPRKPRPNGLLVYTAATYVAHPLHQNKVCSQLQVYN
jgi:hypothetical protein